MDTTNIMMIIISDKDISLIFNQRMAFYNKKGHLKSCIGDLLSIPTYIKLSNKGTDNE